MSHGFFDLRRRRLDAPLRCICFPYAGGNGAAYTEWQALAQQRMDIIAAQMPGRGGRFNEACYVDFETLLGELLMDTLPLLDRPFILFGHSLGALIAYELGRRAHLVAGVAPEGLCVAAARAPHSMRPESAQLSSEDYKLDDASLAAKLGAFGGIPPELLTDTEVLRVTLRAVRADFRVYETYRPPVSLQARRLKWEIAAYGGTEDLGDVPVDSLLQWAECTAGAFEMHLLPGDHFFVARNARRIVDTLLHIATGV